MIILQSFPKSWYEHDFVISQEGIAAEVGLGNSLLIAKPNSTFARYWLDAYKTFNEQAWASHSIDLPKRLWIRFPESVKVLEYDRFLYPSWHTEDLKKVYESNDYDFTKRQYAYHCWSHLAWNYLAELNVEKVKEGNTSFKRALLPLVDDL